MARRLDPLCRPGLTHPGASRSSDEHVHLRFVRGSPATVMRVDAVTGWIEVRGEPFQSTANARRIALRQLANRPGAGESTTDAPAWCPPEGAPAPHPGGRLRLAARNLENPHARDGQSTYLEPDPSAKRPATDYDRIRRYVRLFDPDTLAVRGVDGEAALSRVVETKVDRARW